MLANALDWALLGDAATAVKRNAAAANVSRRAWAKNPEVRPGLLTGRFPSTAARDTSGSAIPFPRSGVANELTVRICTIDGDSHKSPAADAAGNRAARDLAVGDVHG